ncbi:MAG: MFS transporter [Armatimonadetes bacterium]|nr:MFS transporter [Armatimonadota bacterium]
MNPGTGNERKQRRGARLAALYRPIVAATHLPRRARKQAQTAVHRHVPPRARDAFVTDATAMLLAGLYAGSIYPFVSIIARGELGADATVLGFMSAAPYLGYLCSLFWARAMEGRRKVPFVKWSHLAARTTVVLMLFATSAWPFALIISAVQIIGAIATPAYAAIIKEVYPDDTRGRIMSLTRAALLVAQIVATYIVGWLLTTVSYRFVFPVAALVGIVAALVFSRINPNEQAQPAVGDPGAARLPLRARTMDTARYLWDTLGILKVDHAYRWFAFSVFTYGFGNLLITPIIPLVQVDRLHMRTNDLSLLANLSQVVAVFAYFYWGRYVDRRSPQRAVTLNILVNALVPIFYILAIGVGQAWVLIPAFLVSGAIMAGIDLSYFNALLSFSQEHNVARYQALQSFLLGVRGTVAPFIGSMLVSYLDAHSLDRRYAFVVALVFILTGCWMQMMATRRQEAERKTVLQQG